MSRAGFPLVFSGTRAPVSRAGFPLVFRDWTNPGLAAIWERFFADLAEGRGWYPPDPSPILWLSDLAHAEPAALPGIEAIVDELLDDPDPAHVLEGIIGVEGISSVPAQMRLAQRVAKGWNPHPDALRAAVSKLLRMQPDPTSTTMSSSRRMKERYRMAILARWGVRFQDSDHDNRAHPHVGARTTGRVLGRGGLRVLQQWGGP